MTDSQNASATGIQLIANQSLQFASPVAGIQMAVLPIAGAAWIDTDDGVVVIDTLIGERAARQMFERINGQIKYIIYTHGHLDHVGGTAALMRDSPVVVASDYLPDRLDSYKRLARHRARISAQQFNLPEDPERFAGSLQRVVYPTETFIGARTISLGNKTFELRTARAETDDVCWVWIPELKAAFIGDLVIGVFPNIGNPWKPTRFALDWARTLEDVLAKEPEWLFCNGAGLVYQGREALDVLRVNIEVIRSLHDQVVELINCEVHITDMIHQVKVPEHLRESRYLNMSYSKVEFFVYNVYRWYHGYFDGNPANLLPRPQREVAEALLTLIDDEAKVLVKAEQLLAQGQAQLAMEVLDLLLRAQPEHVDARRLRMRLMQVLAEEDTCLMSRNSWVYFLARDRAFLEDRGELTGLY